MRPDAIARIRECRPGTATQASHSRFPWFRRQQARNHSGAIPVLENVAWLIRQGHWGQIGVVHHGPDTMELFRGSQFGFGSGGSLLPTCLSFSGFSGLPHVGGPPRQIKTGPAARSIQRP